MYIIKNLEHTHCRENLEDVHYKNLENANDQNISNSSITSLLIGNEYGHF